MTLPSPSFEMKNGLLIETQSGMTVAFAHAKELEEVTFRIRDPLVGVDRPMKLFGRIIFRTKEGDLTTDPDRGVRGVGFDIYLNERTAENLLKQRAVSKAELNVFLTPGLKLIGAEEFGIPADDVTMVFSN